MADARSVISAYFNVERTYAFDVPGATVTTMVGEVLARNPNRLAVVFVNLGSNPVFIRPEGEAATTSGIRLAANGGGVAFSVVEDFLMPAARWTAIASGGNSTVYIAAVETFGA